MAIQLRASSASSSAHSWTHDVFLSFRGKDTRYNFTDHLHSHLVQEGIKTFRDDKLTRGEEISQALVQAIQGSKSSLIVFSENYASSKWCLEELVHILECKRTNQQKVWPVFYKVDPSDVRNQRGSFGDALANHEHKFKDNMNKVLRWRTALTEAASLFGWHFSDGYESKFIDGIVEEISAQVKEPTYLDVPKCSVGLDSRVQGLLECLDVRESDIRMVGIWGISGIGKTTIAKAVYNSIAHNFERSCFLANVREESEVHGGLLNLQNILLSKIIRGKELKVINVDEGITLLRERLRHKRILVVIDDVNKLDQLKKLAGATDWYGRGSRIIITTRDNHLLIAHQVNLIYKVRELDPHEAREVFSSNVFKNKTNLDDNEELLVSNVVKYAQGLPLELEVLGSHLCGRPIHQWQAILDGYRRDPPKGFQDILKIRYDGLGKRMKEVFLDIACFLKDRNSGCINSKHGIEVLEERSLINVGYGPYGIGTQAKIFTADELRKATNNYHESKKLGEGGYATVFKGILDDGTEVAIKKSKSSAQIQSDQFVNEVIVLSQINHKNVVRIIGCCLETQMPMLVYEFVGNGTLYEHIHKINGKESLSLAFRLKIAVETAGALSYLHYATFTQIIHRDVKSTNILLDEKFTAKVSDFGASRLVPEDPYQLSTLVQGTMGYLDPEYLQSNILTEKSDVYSFGVVLVELLTSKKAVSFDRPKAERNLANVFVSTAENGMLNSILDDEIVKDGNLKLIEKVANLAEKCLSLKGDDRPSMKEVELELSEILHSLAIQQRGKSHSSFKETDDSLESPSNAYGEDEGDIGPTGIITWAKTAVYDASMKIQSQMLKPLDDGR